MPTGPKGEKRQATVVDVCIFCAIPIPKGKKRTANGAVALVRAAAVV
jgi:hypothetical protein